MQEDLRHNAGRPLVIARTPLRLDYAAVAESCTMSLILHNRRVLYRN